MTDLDHCPHLAGAIASLGDQAGQDSENKALAELAALIREKQAEALEEAARPYENAGWAQKLLREAAALRAGTEGGEGGQP